MVAVCALLGGLLLIVDMMHPLEILVELDRRSPWRTAEVKWQSSAPESHGLNASKLDALRDGLAARRTNALLVVRNDQIVYEWYAPGYGPNEAHGTASSAKGLVGGTALLVALSDRRIGLDDPAWKYIPAWKGDPQKREITIRQLATHSSGLENAFEAGIRQGEESGWKGVYWRKRTERFAIALHETPVVSPPGTEVAYSNTGITALGYAITASLKDSSQDSIRALLKERIMEPLGVPDKAWKMSYGEAYKMDDMKLYVIGGGGAFTARAAARVGQLMLQRGNWQGRQLVDSTWAMTSQSDARPSQTECPPNHPAPGLGWWSNSNGVWPSLPRDAFAAAGAGHQIVLVVPSLELVVVRFGKWIGNVSSPTVGHEYWSDLQKHLFEPLMDTISE